MPQAFPHQLAWLLNNPFRALLLSPKTLVARIPLRPTDRILEVGPGSGFFSVALASAVDQGRLDLVDLQANMLTKARAHLEARGLTRVGYTVVDAGEALPFVPGSFDVAVLVAVLGEISNQRQCIRSLATLLKHDAVLAVHEGWPDPDRIPLAILQPLVEQRGFALAAVAGPRWNYTAIFRRR